MNRKKIDLNKWHKNHLQMQRDTLAVQKSYKDTIENHHLKAKEQQGDKKKNRQGIMSKQNNKQAPKHH